MPRLRCGANSPLAVLVACYTGAIDARDDSLGEELVLDEDGPVAAVAATRVTMPYGNTVLGCELLRSAFAQREATLGEVWLRAQRATLADSPADDSLRTSLDSLARGVSPPPVELAVERREHVLLYQLLGDPLLAAQLSPGGRQGRGPARHRSRRPHGEMTGDKLVHQTQKAPGHDASACPGFSQSQNDDPRESDGVTRGT